MSKFKILKVSIVVIISVCLLFTFSYLSACKGAIPFEEAEIIEETLEVEIGEEVAEEEVEEEVFGESPEEETEEIATEEDFGICYNAYFPVKENMIWNYRLQATGIESFNYSLSFNSITDNTFVQVVTIPGGTIESKWNCSELGILQTEYRELNFTDPAAAQIKHKTIGVEGITFPPEGELAIGKTWKVIYDTEAKIKTGDIEMDATVKVEMEYEIISIENVEVPAGNYSDALNIANKVTISISSDFLNTTFSSDSNSWFAKDIGLVKNAGNLDETQTITELISVE